MATQPPAASEETAPGTDSVVRPSPPLPPGPVPAGPAAPPGTKVGFAGSARFVVFAQDGDPSFSVFDRDRGETFRVLGAPIGQPVGSGNRFFDMGVAFGAQQWSLESDREGRILVRSVGGVQLVDLLVRGRMVAAWRGVPVETSLAPDGKSFAVATADAIHIVRASDGAFATFTAASGRIPTWGDTTVYWATDDTLTRVDRETLRASVVRAPAAKAQFATSSDATVVAFASEGTVAVHVEGTAAPILQIASPDETAQLMVDREGTTVVWIERVIDEKAFADKGHLHVIDVAARTHERFPMTNSGCGNAPETIEAIRDGKVITDPSCRIGCPSIRWTSRSVAYDARSGKIVDDSSTTEPASWNEEQSALRAEVEAAATRLRVETSAMLNQPGTHAARFLVERPSSDLTLVGLTAGTTPIALEASKSATVSNVTFSSDGAIVAGVVDGYMRAWDAATGRALLR